MPNYYIQAKRGTFNPFSFDEYVKPLNMYKEYYEKNEEAITDMQEQANLWKNIMESEKDSKLADKYNTYVNNLNNATQQLKNGMSYNLRNQIQQLRGQSAMVKQIENAYNLRAKDIDAYNELMIKDPSRIGADDPTTRGLDMYLNGPVNNNYGVSGDDLYKKGAIAGQAYTLRSKKSFDSTKDGVITTTTMGLTNDDIARELNNPNSDLHKEADKILQAQGITTDMPYYNAAKNEILKGIVDGISYDKQKSYHNIPRQYTSSNGGINNGNNIIVTDPMTGEQTVIPRKGTKIYASGEEGGEIEIRDNMPFYKNEKNEYIKLYRAGSIKANGEEKNSEAYTLFTDKVNIFAVDKNKHIKGVMSYDDFKLFDAMKLNFDSISKIVDEANSNPEFLGDMLNKLGDENLTNKKLIDSIFNKDAMNIQFGNGKINYGADLHEFAEFADNTNNLLAKDLDVDEKFNTKILKGANGEEIGTVPKTNYFIVGKGVDENGKFTAKKIVLVSNDKKIVLVFNYKDGDEKYLEDYNQGSNITFSNDPFNFGV